MARKELELAREMMYEAQESGSAWHSISVSKPASSSSEQQEKYQGSTRLNESAEPTSGNHIKQEVKNASIELPEADHWEDHVLDESGERVSCLDTS